ncbi:alkaline phosphatase [uncultured Endozoicomonas sp.]|uniref:alkaline phosphatase n=1 Tax=uncultured Endozoicomonas sp. TaxID=432652 RepID=UPI00262B9A3C|nr:alkaline phosphatase [uncultured Endozoicomonas sp.]
MDISFNKKAIASTLCAAALLTGCQSMDRQVAGSDTPEVKNIIMMIGDGMGPQQLGLLQEYATNAPSSIYQGQPTGIAQFMDVGVVGLSQHNPAYNIVVDSASSASQLATGEPSPSESLGLNALGSPTETVLERAQKAGKATGLVSDTRATHATPAAFAAHQPHRSLENKIAEEMLANNVDVMFSGGLRHWIPKSVNDKDALYQQLTQRTDGSVRIKSKRKDNKNLLETAENAGYQVALTKTELDAAKGDKVLGLFAYSGMADGIKHTSHKDDLSRTEPTLKEMTAKALDILSQDPDGFFLMVEGGRIDWAGHDNDAGTMLHELLKFDEAIGYVYDWVKDRNDTLVVITADHETGGFGFSYSRADIPVPSALTGEAFEDWSYKPNFNFGTFDILDKLYSQKMSFPSMFSAFSETDKTPEDLAAIVNANSEFDITVAQAREILANEQNRYQVAGHKYLSSEIFPKVKDFGAFYVYGEEIRHDLLGRAVAEDQNVVWGTGTHTSTPVPVIAFGPAAATAPFGKMIHHTDIGRISLALAE